MMESSPSSGWQKLLSLFDDTEQHLTDIPLENSDTLEALRSALMECRRRYEDMGNAMPEIAAAFRGNQIPVSIGLEITGGSGEIHLSSFVDAAHNAILTFESQTVPNYVQQRIRVLCVELRTKVAELQISLRKLEDYQIKDQPIKNAHMLASAVLQRKQEEAAAALQNQVRVQEEKIAKKRRVLEEARHDLTVVEERLQQRDRGIVTPEGYKELAEVLETMIAENRAALLHERMAAFLKEFGQSSQQVQSVVSTVKKPAEIKKGKHEPKETMKNDGTSMSPQKIKKQRSEPTHVVDLSARTLRYGSSSSRTNSEEKTSSSPGQVTEALSSPAHVSNNPHANNLSRNLQGRFVHPFDSEILVRPEGIQVTPDVREDFTRLIEMADQLALKLRFQEKYPADFLDIEPSSLESRKDYIRKILAMYRGRINPRAFCKQCESFVPFYLDVPMEQFSVHERLCMMRQVTDGLYLLLEGAEGEKYCFIAMLHFFMQKYLTCYVETYKEYETYDEEKLQIHLKKMMRFPPGKTPNCDVQDAFFFELVALESQRLQEKFSSVEAHALFLLACSRKYAAQAEIYKRMNRPQAVHEMAQKARIHLLGVPGDFMPDIVRHVFFNIQSLLTFS